MAAGRLERVRLKAGTPVRRQSKELKAVVAMVGRMDIGVQGKSQ